MTLTATPGSATADTYATLAEADAYHSAMGNTAWGDADDADKETALRRAVSWLDGRYGPSYPGIPTDSEQALLWPRLDVLWRDVLVPSDSIPAPIKKAQMEGALRELATPGSLSPDYVPSEVVTSVNIGPISETYASAGGSVQPLLTSVDGILRELLGGRASNIRQVVRA